VPRTSDKRERLLRSADRLILSKGFRQTTLADIAEDSEVPLGNVYYYFKTKDDICKSIIDIRINAIRQLLDQCAEADDPQDRLQCLLDYPLTVRRELSDNGCPLGTLSYELSHYEGALNTSSTDLIAVVLDWVQEQFEAMGKPGARALALQLVSNLQGMSLIANALRDPDVVKTMVNRTRDWLDTL